MRPGERGSLSMQDACSACLSCDCILKSPAASPIDGLTLLRIFRAPDRSGIVNDVREMEFARNVIHFRLAFWIRFICNFCFEVKPVVPRIPHPKYVPIK